MELESFSTATELITFMREHYPGDAAPPPGMLERLIELQQTEPPLSTIVEE